MAAIATAAAAVATTEKTGLLAKQVVAAPAKEKKTKSYWEAFTDFKGNSDQLFYRSGAIRSGPSLLMLDGLRALAFLWVLVLHFSQRTKVSLGVPDAQQGVTVFFVLSGYLIAMVVASALRRSNNAFIPTYFKFLAGRFFRIWPAYIVSIICLQMYYSVLRGHGVFEACGYPGGIVRATTEYGLFLQNWLNPSHFGNDGVTALVDPTVFADKALQDKYMTMGAPGCMYKQSSGAPCRRRRRRRHFVPRNSQKPWPLCAAPTPRARSAVPQPAECRLAGSQLRGRFRPRSTCTLSRRRWSGSTRRSRSTVRRPAKPIRCIISYHETVSFSRSSY